jgi:sugar phosphate isomerase/epimerase
MRRRDFLGVLGTGVGMAGRLNGWSLPGCISGISGPPDGGPVERLKHIGIQLYTLRGEFARDVEGTLARVADIGFTEVEFAGYSRGTAASLRAMLDRLGLAAPSSHVALQSLRGEWERRLDEAALLGQGYIVVASLAASERRTLDDWKRVAALFNKAGEIAKGRGIQFCYHNHDFEWKPLDGVVPYDLLLQETDPTLVQLQLDLYWIAKAGQEPLEYFAKWPGRFPLVHVKDMDNTPLQSFADVGTGTIDFKRIFAKANQAGIRHYFYEQDTTSGAPLDSARASYTYLRNLTF